MNILSPEKVQQLRDAFDLGLDPSWTARDLSLHHHTVERYFGKWNSRKWNVTVPSDVKERAQHFRVIAEVEEFLAKDADLERAARRRRLFYMGLEKLRSAKSPDAPR